ncbi:CvpA family protein [Gilvimarinus xylanilyticus]|uniref:CvpA family protein n=1 Tax=Gilvimarinus xylanilyticus TaxID=2944139 RepID=A0A9X2I217_9GAMM|nr:CvpA family protein [Gilvimarinus xylanilyticus]MCP8898087.1 CvpA family protein [Gilvimarinus xylanilyticus]
MATATIIFLVITGFFAIRGYFNGFWGSLSRSVSFIGAYGAAFYFSKDAAALVKAHTPLEGAVAYLAGSIGLFVLAMFGLRLIFWLLKQMMPGSNDKPGTVSRVGGLLIGALIGGFIGLLLVYTLDIYTSAKELKADAIETPPPPANNAISKAAKLTVSKSAGALMALSGVSDNSIQLSEAFISDPVANMDRVNRVTQNPDLKKMLDDRRTQRLLRRGEIDELMQVPEFKRLIADPDMKYLMQASGMDINDKDSARETARKVSLGWQRIEVMKNDPRVQEIINDPEFQQQLNASNKLALLTNPKLNELAGIIFEEGSDNLATLEQDSQYRIRTMESGEDATVNEDEAGTIYRYTDKNGNVRYSDRPVED